MDKIIGSYDGKDVVYKKESVQPGYTAHSVSYGDVYFEVTEHKDKNLFIFPKRWGYDNNEVVLIQMLLSEICNG